MLNKMLCHIYSYLQRRKKNENLLQNQSRNLKINAYIKIYIMCSIIETLKEFHYKIEKFTCYIFQNNTHGSWNSFYFQIHFSWNLPIQTQICLFTKLALSFHENFPSSFNNKFQENQKLPVFETHSAIVSL